MFRVSGAGIHLVSMNGGGKMILPITGHREIDDWNFAEEAILDAYKELRASYVIQGMAAGIDLRSAVLAYPRDLPYPCARPWAGHPPRKADRELYQEVL